MEWNAMVCYVGKSSINKYLREKKNRLFDELFLYFIQSVLNITPKKDPLLLSTDRRLMIILDECNLRIGDKKGLGLFKVNCDQVSSISEQTILTSQEGAGCVDTVLTK